MNTRVLLRQLQPHAAAAVPFASPAPGSGSWRLPVTRGRNPPSTFRNRLRRWQQVFWVCLEHFGDAPLGGFPWQKARWLRESSGIHPHVPKHHSSLWGASRCGDPQDFGGAATGNGLSSVCPVTPPTPPIPRCHPNPAPGTARRYARRPHCRGAGPLRNAPKTPGGDREGVLNAPHTGPGTPPTGPSSPPRGPVPPSGPGTPSRPPRVPRNHRGATEGGPYYPHTEPGTPLPGPVPPLEGPVPLTCAADFHAWS